MRGENAANRDNTALPESLGGSFEKDGHKNISCFCKIYSWRIFPVTITSGQHDNHSWGSQNQNSQKECPDPETYNAIGYRRDPLPMSVALTLWPFKHLIQ